MISDARICSRRPTDQGYVQLMSLFGRIDKGADLFQLAASDVTVNLS